MARDWIKHPELRTIEFSELYFESPHRQITDDFFCKVEKVIDGDTINVKWEGRGFIFKVRLGRIAAPELGEDGGKESKKALENLIDGKEIDVLINPKNRVGKWGRLIGEVMHAGLNINDEMVRQGKAIPFSQAGKTFIPDFNRMLEDHSI